MSSIFGWIFYSMRLVIIRLETASKAVCSPVALVTAWAAKALKAIQGTVTFPLCCLAHIAVKPHSPDGERKPTLLFIPKTLPLYSWTKDIYIFHCLHPTISASTLAHLSTHHCGSISHFILHSGNETGFLLHQLAVWTEFSLQCFSIQYSMSTLDMRHISCLYNEPVTVCNILHKAMLHITKQLEVDKYYCSELLYLRNTFIQAFNEDSILSLSQGSRVQQKQKTAS